MGIEAFAERISVSEQSSIRYAGSSVLYFDPFRIPDAGAKHEAGRGGRDDLKLVLVEPRGRRPAAALRIEPAPQRHVADPGLFAAEVPPLPPAVHVLRNIRCARIRPKKVGAFGAPEEQETSGPGWHHLRAQGRVFEHQGLRRYRWRGRRCRKKRQSKKEEPDSRRMIVSHDEIRKHRAGVAVSPAARLRHSAAQDRP